MGWARSAVLWAVVCGVLGAILVVLDDADDPAWFVVTMTAIGAALGLVFHQRDRSDDREDADLERAAVDPTSLTVAAGWITLLRSGQSVQIRSASATLTPDGVEGVGRRERSIRWDEVERVSSAYLPTRIRRSGRRVNLLADGATVSIACDRRNFADVLAVCTAMTAPDTGDRPPAPMPHR